ncbi:MAG: anthranilate synthase component I, partial [bacterium]|nr:anthranilate synthase component I [bacterium]
MGIPVFTLIEAHVIQPNLQTLKTLAKSGGLVPVSRAILGDTETPVSAYMKIRSRSPYSFLLESVEGGEKIGRYSFLGVEPFLIFRSRGKRFEVTDLKQGETRVEEGDPIEALRGLLRRYRSVHVAGMPRFTGGAVGYVGYDAIRLIEDIPETALDDLGMDDIVLLFFDTLLGFDNVQHKIHLISNVHTDGDLEANYQAAVDRLEGLEKALHT